MLIQAWHSKLILLNSGSSRQTKLFFNFEETKETTLGFSKETVKVL